MDSREKTKNKMKRQPSQWGENCKWSNGQGVNLQNKPLMQFNVKQKWKQKQKQTHKVGGRSKQTFIQRRQQMAKKEHH